MSFTESQIERYSRHIILKEVGGAGQQKLLNSKVLIIGAGGLGAPIALYLAAAGVGTLGIIDGDQVDLSNLQRQVIHFTDDVGKAKVESAREKIQQMNPDVTVKTYFDVVHADNILDIISDYDFVVDGTDNFAAKFLINDACVIGKKPFSHGGILRFDGQTMTVVPGSACYRCVFDGPPPTNAVPTCSQAGVLGAVAGMLGTTQAAEVLKYLIGTGELLTNRLLIFNANKMQFRTVSFKKNPKCKVCGDHPSILKPENGEQAVCDLKQ
jgi:molybdopterin-synthase adenylyltransferase